ncbi:hypothetical protein H6G36_03680 [Anabaena minutissima FACHB-250]|nr:hypothetical protein [Anabaena minutissima FACHB-250]
MKQSELVRIVGFSVFGGLLMFWIQPFFYRIPLPFFVLPSVDKLDAWIGNYYIPGATIVLASSICATLLWYVLASRAQPRTAHDRQSWLLVWCVILFIPVLSIIATLFFYSHKPEAILSLTTLYIFDAAFLYWFTTATSSPRDLMYTPPGAFTLRRLPLFRN